MLCSSFEVAVVMPLQESDEWRCVSSESLFLARMDGADISLVTNAHNPIDSRTFCEADSHALASQSFLHPQKVSRVFTFHLHPLTMSDDADYHIEQADAGASATIPMEAGQIKKGG